MNKLNVNDNNSQNNHAPYDTPVYENPLSLDVIAHLKELIGYDDPGFLIELLDTYLEDAQRTILALPEAWQIDDQSGIMRAAHSLKAASATLTATKLESLTSQLEDEMRGHSRGLDIASQIEQIIAEYARVQTALLRLRIQITEHGLQEG